ncbi:hypothetical protein RR46_04290 [Papilio xuthus]|uniref:PNT domain-containing protein n=1 Tax=Papilio xuthus TaxID=66420 RepID=A0A194QDP9_PAPXU|nr:hypothetical protein RR46_04290 [Papilio xuthus]
MLDHARHYEQNMCELYLAPAPPAPERLDAFQVFRKSNTTPYVYGTYYNHYDAFAEPDVDAAANVYHNLLNSRDYHRDDWKYKSMAEWTEDDTLSWVVDAAAAAQGLGFCEYDIPFCNFRIPGVELRGLKREDIVQKMAHLNIDAAVSRRIGDVVYEKLQARVHEEIMRHSGVYRDTEGETYASPETAQTMLDLDSLDHKNRLYALDYRAADAALRLPCDSSDDDVFRTSDTASPEYYGSDGSKSGDEEDKRKQFKRPPGRPKGSGRKVCKRPRSVSVPEFLRNLLLDPKYCPSIIKWEDHSQGKFRIELCALSRRGRDPPAAGADGTSRAVKCIIVQPAQCRVVLCGALPCRVVASAGRAPCRRPPVSTRIDFFPSGPVRGSKAARTSAAYTCQVEKLVAKARRAAPEVRKTLHVEPRLVPLVVTK